MGWYVHIHVCFACNTNEGVAKLAKKHRELLTGKDDGQREALWFLEALSERTGGNPGPKGGLSLWGIVGNYTSAEVFCEVLKPFWRELLTGDIDGGPCRHEHIVVFEEPEQSDAANVFEIGWTDPYSEADRELFIRKHERLPFSWVQA